MNPTRYLRARLVNSAQSALYLVVLVSLLMFSGWLLLGGFGVVMMLVLTGATLVASSQLPVALMMRMRGARPLLQGEAESVELLVARLAGQAGLAAPPRLYLVPNLELQAFAVQSAGQAAVGFTPALVRTLTLAELEGVLAHEISHLASGDTRLMGVATAMRGLTRSLASLAWLLLLFSLLLPGLFVVSLGAMALLLAAPVLSYLAELGLSRTREFNADIAAANLTGHPEQLARALAKLDRHHQNPLSRLLGQGFVVAIPEALRSHPSTQERIRRLLALRQEGPRGGRPSSGGGRRLPPQDWPTAAATSSYPAGRSNRWSVTTV